jgi:hypothetical protein
VRQIERFSIDSGDDLNIGIEHVGLGMSPRDRDSLRGAPRHRLSIDRFDVYRCAPELGRSARDATTGRSRFA